MSRTSLPDTPIIFVDQPSEVHRLCEEWRVAAANKAAAYAAKLAKAKEEAEAEVQRKKAAEAEAAAAAADAAAKKPPMSKGGAAAAKKLLSINAAPFVPSSSSSRPAPSSSSSYGYMPQSDYSKSLTDGGKLLLGIDLEGRDLGHDGSVDILAIYDVDANKTYLFDTFTMQEAAFTAGASGNNKNAQLWSLKELIEIGGGRNGDVVFLIYDTRMDSAALYHIYGVRLGGYPTETATAITTTGEADSAATALSSQQQQQQRPFGGLYDLQIAKCNIAGGAYLIGLAKALALYLTPKDHAATEKGRAVFAPERGGEYSLWAARPLPKDLLEYCAVTIRYYGFLFDEVGIVQFGKSIESIMEMTERRLVKQVEQKRPKQRDAKRDF